MLSLIMGDRFVLLFRDVITVHVIDGFIVTGHIAHTAMFRVTDTELTGIAPFIYRVTEIALITDRFIGIVRCRDIADFTKKNDLL